MVGELTTLLLEEVVTLLEGIHHVSKLRDGDTADLLQLMNVCGELWLLDVHRLVEDAMRESS